MTGNCPHVYCASPSSLIHSIVRRRGAGGEWRMGGRGEMTSCSMQQAAFEVPVLKEPLIAIRISLNKRLRNIGWFLAFASRSCLLTSKV